MNFRTTAILAVVLAVALGTFLFVSNRKPAATTDESKVLDVKSAAVTHIVITPKDGKKTVLDKPGADWRLVEPVAACADSRLVDNLLRVITELQPLAFAEKSDVSDLGLDKPAWTVDVKANGKDYRLRITGRPLTGDSVYVLVDGNERPARVLMNPLLEQLDKKPESYRETKLITGITAPSQIQQMVITDMSGEKVKQKIVMAKQAGTWQVIEPQKVKADPNVADDLARDIINLNATSFVEEKEIPSISHPRTPTRTVWFSTEAPTTQPAGAPPAGTTIAFGGEDGRKSVYAYIESTKTYAKVGIASAEAFNKSVLDLKDKVVVDIDPAKVSNVSIQIHRAATTRPTTMPVSDKEVVIERRKQNLVMAASTSRPATQPTTRGLGALFTDAVEGVKAAAGDLAEKASDAMEKKPKASTWTYKTSAMAEPADAGDARVSQLLERFHSLRADKWVASAYPPADAPGTWTVEITTEEAGSTTKYQFFLVDRGADKPLGATFQDQFFDVSRFLADLLNSDFDAKAAPPMPSGFPEGFPGGGGGLPPGMFGQ